MAGTYSSETKIRPGAYTNVKSNSLDVNMSASRGIVAIPLVLDWGKVNEVIEIDSTSNLKPIFGYDITDSQMLLIRETLKNAKKLLVYRLNSGLKASKTVDGFTITAKYEGTRGNDITVRILANVDTEDFTVETFLGDSKVDSQNGTKVSDLISNEYVEFSGTEDLTANAGIKLEGGTNQTVSGSNYTTFLEKIEKFKFNVLAITTEDVTSIKAVLKTFVKRLRDSGKYIQMVISNYDNADYEGIISVKNGVILDDGTVLNASKACAYVAGIMAAADVNKSNTYEVYDGAVNVDTIYTDTEIEEALTKGELVFTIKNDKVIIEQDINTLVTYTVEKNQYFHKNRVVRCIDTLQEEITTLFENYYIGKVNNDEDGRTLFKSAVIKLINDNYVQKAAIRDFENGDVTVEAGDEIDTIRMKIGIKPVDAIEKLYTVITLQGGNE